MVLLLGIYSSGLAIAGTISLNEAGREASRFGATRPVQDISVWLDDVSDVAVTAASGDLAADVTGRYVCVAFVHPAGVAAHDRTARLEEIGAQRTITAGVPCFDDGRPLDERRVQVVVGRNAAIDAFVYQHTIALRARSIARYERLL